MDVDVIHLDFAKTFDKVDHKILPRKLLNMGIRETLHNWSKPSYLIENGPRITHP